MILCYYVDMKTQPPEPTEGELYQQRRAIEAEKYINSPEYKRLLEQDQERRKNLDISLGHSPKCGILTCHPDCPSLRGKTQ